jgi:putative ABC transport system ATP-binding protein
MTTLDTLIRLDRLQKVFLTEEIEIRALADVEMEITRGEFVAISGPSGCGKSTLLGILGLLDTPTAGRYFLKNRDVARLDFTERARVRNREIGFISAGSFQAERRPPEAREQLN